MMYDVFEKWFDNKMSNIHTCIPGIIEEYEGHEKRKAKVKPMIKIRTAQNKLIEIPPIDDVPVMFLSTNRFNMLFPLEQGDGVLLLFSESALGNFLNSDSESDADDMTKFALTDCIAIPGLWSFKTAPDIDTNNEDFFLVFDDFRFTVREDGSTFLLQDGEKTKIESTDDGLHIESNDNNISINGNGVMIEDSNNNSVEMGAGGIDITDANGNEINMSGISVTINNNFEVLQ